MRDPFVSVLITSYNRETYIGSSIESVLAQWFGDFEVIVVDDASTDGTVEIAQSFASRDKRVRVVCNETRLGQFPNRNHAATLARTGLLKYHDSDDLMYPHCLSVMVPLMLAEPRAAIGISLPHRFSGGPVPMLLTPKMAYEREFLGMGIFDGGPAAGIFRAEVFNELGGFPDQGPDSDTLFWLYACARVSVLAMPADLYWQRRHESQVLSNPDWARDVAGVVGLTWTALDDEACPLDASETARAREAVVTRLIRATLREMRQGNWAAAVTRMRSSGLSPLQILKHARARQHSALAGTPLTPDGKFITPDWRSYSMPSEDGEAH